MNEVEEEEQGEKCIFIPFFIFASLGSILDVKTFCFYNSEGHGNIPKRLLILLHYFQ